MAKRFLSRKWESVQSLRLLRVAIVLAAAATLAFGWVDTRNSIEAYETATIERATLNTRIKARAASEAMQAKINGVDVVLKSARAVLADKPAFERFTRRVLSAFPADVPVQLFHVDRNGYVVYSSGGAAPRAFVGDRDYFLDLQSADADVVVITPPAGGRFGERGAGSHWTLVVARAIWHEGGFDGVIAAEVPLVAWTARFRRLEIGSGDVLTLVDDRGNIIFRTLEVTHEGVRAPVLTQDFLDRLKDEHGSYVGSTGFDDVVRLYAWSPAGNGLAMLSGLALDHVLELVRNQRQRALTRAAILSSALVLAVLALLLVLQRYQRAAERLAAREAHYRRVFSTMVEGVMVLDAQGRIVSVNPAFCAIVGHSRSELLRRGLELLSSREADLGGLRALVAEQAATDGGEEPPREVDFAGERADGSRYIAHARLSPAPAAGSDDGGRVVLIADVTQSRRRDREIWQRANYDSLTGLANRALMKDRLERMIAHAQRREHRVTVLFLDLDRFKPVNDEHGHEIGDLLLSAVARRLESLFRAEDTVARLGGDEFVVLIPADADGAGGRRAAEAIVASLSEPFHLAGLDLSISASVGIARFPEDGDSAQALLDHADREMYRQKRSRAAPAA